MPGTDSPTFERSLEELRDEARIALDQIESLFTVEAKRVAKATDTPLEKIVAKELRDTPIGEVRHTYRNFYQLLESLTRIMRFPATRDRALAIMEVQIDQVGASQMRLRAWEQKPDFLALGWKGPLPSETMQNVTTHMGELYQAMKDPSGGRLGTAQNGRA